MGTEITTQIQQEHHVARALEQLTPSRLWPSDGPRDLEAIQSAVDALTEEANPVWLMARIASLLSPYYEKDVPQAVREMEAEDWAVALEDYPQWAVERSVRWWKGKENPDRKRRPLEGDIAAKCFEYMDGVRAARRILASGEEIWAGQTLINRVAPPPRERVTKEAAAEILARAGYAPRRME